MVVSDPDKAKEALIAAGYLCHVIDVIGVEVEDKTGNLNDLLLTLKDSNVSVDYLYPVSYTHLTGPKDQHRKQKRQNINPAFVSFFIILFFY